MIYSWLENVKSVGVTFSGVYILVSRLRGTLIEFAYSDKNNLLQTVSLLNFPISNISSVSARILSMPTTRN